MFSKSIILTIIGLVVLCGAICLIFAAIHHRHFSNGEKRAAWITKKIAKKLDLSEDQKIKFNSIRDKIIEKTPEFHQMRKDVRREIIEQLRKDKAIPSEINAYFENKHDKLVQMRMFLVDQYSEFHNMLNPTQREKMAALIEKYHSKRGCRHGCCRR